MCITSGILGLSRSWGLGTIPKVTKDSLTEASKPYLVDYNLGLKIHK